MNTHQKGSTVQTVLITIVLVLIIVGIYSYSQNKNSTSAADTTTAKVLPFSDSDLHISYSTIPVTDNSAPALNTIALGSVSKMDLDFLNKYVATSSSEILPLAQAQKVLASNQNLLKIFDTNVGKPYQCNLGKGESCGLNGVRYVAYFATLRALVALQQKKIAEAEKTAVNTVDLGKSVTLHADTEISLLVGWITQKLGYSVLLQIPAAQRTFTLTDAKKAELILQLRSEHKKVLQYDYVRLSEGVDYITSTNNKPQSQVVTTDDEEVLNSYRQAIATNPTAWNPQETKKYFYDSYKKMITNVDLPCGSAYPNSKVDTHFDQKDEKTPNYIGKAMYSVVYASIDSMSVKRCEIEKAIQSL